MIFKSNTSNYIKKYLQVFPSGSNSELTEKINDFYKNRNLLDTKNKLFTFLQNIIPHDYLSEFSKSKINENNNQLINFYEKFPRNSGKPGAIHPLSVEFILSTLQLPDYVIIAGANHDNVEQQIDIYKNKQKRKKNKVSLETVTTNLLNSQFRSLKNTSFKLAKTNNSHIKLKEIAYSCVLLQKVTKFELDKNYYQSIDKIFDKNISQSNKNLSGIFEEFKIESGKELKFDDKEITMLIESAACIKLADRISNTLDTYDNQTFIKRIKDIYKSIYVINRVTEYMNSVSIFDRFNNTYRTMSYLRDVLIKVNEKILRESISNFDYNARISDKDRLDIKNELSEYKKQKGRNGFISLDYGFDYNVFSGNLRSVWNPAINNNKKIIDVINDSSFEQLLTLTCLKEINDNLKKDISVKGFDKLGREESLGYMDDMGEKYSKTWEDKRDYRLFKSKQISKKISSFDSYYEATGEKSSHDMPSGMIKFLEEREKQIESHYN